MPSPTLKERIQTRIAGAEEQVFLPREFRDLGGEDQVLRALRALVQEKRLLKLGYGVYGRSFVSSLTGRAVLDSDFLVAARQVLDKLGVPWEPTAAQNAYNEGRTTQVPVNPRLKIKGRFSRKLRLGNMELRFER